MPTPNLGDPNFMPSAVYAYPVPYAKDILVLMPVLGMTQPVRISFEEAYRLKRDLERALDTQAGWPGQPTQVPFLGEQVSDHL